MEAVVDRIPPPEGSKEEPLKALIFDSLYDTYRGVIAYICVKEGEVKVGDKIKMMANEKEYEVLELGVSTPTPVSKDKLTVGEVGFLTAAMKEVKDTEVGDTITKVKNQASEALTGYRQTNTMDFCGLYPVSSDAYNGLSEALVRIEISDDVLNNVAMTSQA